MNKYELYDLSLFILWFLYKSDLPNSTAKKHIRMIRIKQFFSCLTPIDLEIGKFLLNISSRKKFQFCIFDWKLLPSRWCALLQFLNSLLSTLSVNVFLSPYFNLILISVVLHCDRYIPYCCGQNKMLSNYSVKILAYK